MTIGAAVSRCSGVPVSRCNGATVQRCFGATVSRCHGVPVQEIMVNRKKCIWSWKSCTMKYSFSWDRMICTILKRYYSCIFNAVSWCQGFRGRHRNTAAPLHHDTAAPQHRNTATPQHQCTKQVFVSGGDEEVRRDHRPFLLLTERLCREYNLVQPVNEKGGKAIGDSQKPTDSR